METLKYYQNQVEQAQKRLDCAARDVRDAQETMKHYQTVLEIATDELRDAEIQDRLAEMDVWTR